MCGRYASSRKPDDLIVAFEVDEPMVAVPLEPDYNVAPTKEVYAVLERPRKPTETHLPASDGAPHEVAKLGRSRQLRVLTWGLIPSWAKDPKIGSRLINARMETVGEKPAFRKAFATRRCLLPADGYYEWYATSQTTERGKPIKQPFFIRPRDDAPLAMAGLYEIWRDPAKADDAPDRFRWTCTVVTTTAEDDLGEIHERMPLMVPPQRWSSWLDPHAQPHTLIDLLEPAAPGRLEAFPVATLVNNVANNGPALVQPLPSIGAMEEEMLFDDVPGGDC